MKICSYVSGPLLRAVIEFSEVDDQVLWAIWKWGKIDNKFLNNIPKVRGTYIFQEKENQSCILNKFIFVNFSNFSENDCYHVV